MALKCPTEIAITDRREKELSDLGFIPLVHCKNTDYAAFFAAQSAQQAKSYNTDAANANARLSTQIQYIMAVSRIAHYLKAMMRDKIGSFMSRSECEMFLNNWITTYVCPMDDASQAVKAERPLRDARIDVVEDPKKPGCYKAVAFLRAPLPARRADGLAPPGGRAAPAGREVAGEFRRFRHGQVSRRTRRCNRHDGRVGAGSNEAGAFRWLLLTIS